jgi:DNA anti-recombination protein RmuC
MLAVNNAVNSTLESFASKSAQCIADYTQLKATMQTTLNQKNSELIDQEDKLTELQTRYNMLASTSARSICCKQKVDDDSVDSYSLTNNRISCGTGLENGLVC